MCVTRFMAFAFVCLFVVACGGTDDTKQVPGIPDGPQQVLESDTYVLQPGEEKYYCYTMNLPADTETVVTSFVPKYGPGTHHILFVQTMTKEPDGMFECPVLFKTTWLPLYAGGVKSSPLVLPEGAAVRLPKGQQVLMQLHLQNPSASPISAKTAVTLKLADPAEKTIPAGIWGMDNRAIDLAPQVQDAETSMSCASTKEMDMFGMLGHMHKMGKQIDIFAGDKPEGDPVLSEQWSFSDQPILPFERHVAKGDVLTLRCRHSNTTMKQVGYGESSDQEMCAAVFFYTPFDALSGCLYQPPSK